MLEQFLSEGPAVYASLFSAHCTRKASGQREGRHEYVLVSSIKGMVWFIALRGGKSVSLISLHKGLANWWSSSLTDSMHCSSGDNIDTIIFVSGLALSGNASSLPTTTRVGLNPRQIQCWYIHRVPRIKL